MDIIVASSTRALVHRLSEIIGPSERLPEWRTSLSRAVEQLESQTYDVLMVTGEILAMERDEGTELLEVVASECPSTQVVLLVESHELEIASGALKAGARHYGRLPMTDDELKMLLEAAYATRPEYGANHLLAASENGFQGIIGESPAMQEAFRQIRLAAAIDVPVLIEGETGTGKDLVAGEIHRQSSRMDKPYVAVNLGAIPDELVGSELFGHAKGAFTGAVTSREGKFEEGREGTVFLDEIGTIDERVQVSLLRLLEENQFTRLGGRKRIRNGARVIAATNQPLTKLVEAGLFREDLFYRLDVFRIAIPPLRERTGDVRLLTEVFVGRFSKQFGKQVRSIKDDVLDILERQPWNGNVRELKNVIRRSVLSCGGTELTASHLPTRLQQTQTEAQSALEVRIGSTLAEVEKELIAHTLASVGQNRTEASRVLGISRRALYNKMEKYGIR